MLSRAILILIGLSLPVSLQAAKTQYERTQSFTIGHFTQRTFELREYSRNGEQAYSLKHYRNGKLEAGRALTKATYEEIQKDWRLVLPNPAKKQPASTCAEFVRITKTIKDGVKHEALCSGNWGKAQSLRFQSFVKKMKMLANSQQPYYERL